MLREIYLHPSGQIPAYEWNFRDVNPPVHAWATIFLYRVEQALRGEGDIEFMKRSFGKLIPTSPGGSIVRTASGKTFSRAASWVSTTSAYSIARRRCPAAAISNRPTAPRGWRSSARTCSISAWRLRPTTRPMKIWSMKFLEHFLWIGRAMNHVGPDGMWDEEDGFYYDVLRLPDGRAIRLKVRSMVGLLPLCATTVIEPWQRERVPRLVAHFAERVRRMPELAAGLSTRRARAYRGYGDRGILAVVNPERLRRILTRCSTRTSS